ncbi:hypothetical protein DL93DRAFT_2151289 [Clavulina sp. PMI_390]|nr:hypothetical protein DL93DRAFT_2151289 [Clavulina sp. PMI_390]
MNVGPLANEGARGLKTFAQTRVLERSEFLDTLEKPKVDFFFVFVRRRWEDLPVHQGRSEMFERWFPPHFRTQSSTSWQARLPPHPLANNQPFVQEALLLLSPLNEKKNIRAPFKLKLKIHYISGGPSVRPSRRTPHVLPEEGVPKLGIDDRVVRFREFSHVTWRQKTEEGPTSFASGLDSERLSSPRPRDTGAEIAWTRNAIN